MKIEMKKMGIKSGQIDALPKLKNDNKTLLKSDSKSSILENDQMKHLNSCVAYFTVAIGIRNVD
jgi:hypothetical protein